MLRVPRLNSFDLGPVALVVAPVLVLVVAEWVRSVEPEPVELAVVEFVRSGELAPIAKPMVVLAEVVAVLAPAGEHSLPADWKD